MIRFPTPWRRRSVGPIRPEDYVGEDEARNERGVREGFAAKAKRRGSRGHASHERRGTERETGHRGDGARRTCISQVELCAVLETGHRGHEAAKRMQSHSRRGVRKSVLKHRH
jgi:hypothetical protein